ncbi:MAG: DUF4388 domain-containing protein [Polyangiaceae bacterium]|nr:DUF4388 domain-containing protein [Polyangiaceae bacterium]
MQVNVCASVAEALATMQTPLDALVCDASLPANGLDELLKGLRASTQGGHVPVLCLVPDEPSGGRLAALQAGVDVCLSQPFRVDELVAQIEALLALVARTLPPPALPASMPAPRSLSAGLRPPLPPSGLRPPAPPSGLRPPAPPSGLRPSAPSPHVSSSARRGSGRDAPATPNVPPSSPRRAAGPHPPPAQRVGPSAPPPSAQRRESLPPPSALEGDLAHVSLSTVLSVLEMERRSGVISVDDGGAQAATIDLNFGNAVGGSLAGVRVAPLAVLRQVLAWPRGRFRFQPGLVAETRTGNRSLGALLIEAMRLADEAAVMNDPSGLDEDVHEVVEVRSASSSRLHRAALLEDTATGSRPLPRAPKSSPPPASSPKSSLPPSFLGRRRGRGTPANASRCGPGTHPWLPLRARSPTVPMNESRGCAGPKSLRRSGASCPADARRPAAACPSVAWRLPPPWRPPPLRRHERGPPLPLRPGYAPRGPLRPGDAPAPPPWQRSPGARSRRRRRPRALRRRGAQPRRAWCQRRRPRGHARP